MVSTRFANWLGSLFGIKFLPSAKEWKVKEVCSEEFERFETVTTHELLFAFFQRTSSTGRTQREYFRAPVYAQRSSTDRKAALHYGAAATPVASYSDSSASRVCAACDRQFE